MRKYSTLSLGLLLPLLLPLCWSSRVRAEDEGNAQAGLTGTWIVNVSANPISICNGPEIAPGPPPFVELATYAAGGTFTETNSELNANSAGSALHLAGSDGYGAWERHGSRFKNTFRKLLFDPTGTYVGNVDFHESISVEPQDHLSGSFTVEFSFFNGSPSICSSGTVSGQRMTTR